MFATGGRGRGSRRQVLAGTCISLILAVGGCSRGTERVTTTAPVTSTTVEAVASTAVQSSVPTTVPESTEPAAPATDTGLAVFCDPEDASAELGVWPATTWDQACDAVMSGTWDSLPTDDPVAIAEEFLTERTGWTELTILEDRVTEPADYAPRAYVTAEAPEVDGSITVNLVELGGYWFVASVWMTETEHPPMFSLAGDVLWLGAVAPPEPGLLEVDVQQGSSILVDLDATEVSTTAIIDRRLDRPIGVTVMWSDGETVTAIAAFAVGAGDSAAG